jgi:hypothetical protein
MKGPEAGATLAHGCAGAAYPLSAIRFFLLGNTDGNASVMQSPFDAPVCQTSRAARTEFIEPTRDHLSCMYPRVKPILKRASGAILTALALATLGPASAQQTDLQSYEVELVIFRHLASNGTPEQTGLDSAFGTRAGLSDDDPSTLESPVENPLDSAVETFPGLPSSKFKLTAIEEALRRSRNYRPVAHIGWTQPGYPINAARYLSVNSFVPASSGLTGRIALSRGRYLHLTLDLVYENAEPDSDSRGRHVLKQSRRMRSNERHYIDHPEFGVIAVVTPSGG